MLLCKCKGLCRILKYTIPAIDFLANKFMQIPHRYHPETTVTISFAGGALDEVTCSKTDSGSLLPQIR